MRVSIGRISGFGGDEKLSQQTCETTTAIAKERATAATLDVSGDQQRCVE